MWWGFFTEDNSLVPRYTLLLLNAILFWMHFADLLNLPISLVAFLCTLVSVHIWVAYYDNKSWSQFEKLVMAMYYIARSKYYTKMCSVYFHVLLVHIMWLKCAMSLTSSINFNRFNVKLLLLLSRPLDNVADIESRNVSLFLFLFLFCSILSFVSNHHSYLNLPSQIQHLNSPAINRHSSRSQAGYVSTIEAIQCIQLAILGSSQHLLA